ncbi:MULTISPECIES: helix-turn-helix domain-containing protein [unclassified Rhodanobacter]|uniref:helix-turn-helix domain-containing protein n=1 Tax=unclassified Rhodanobacter TaxID=2621553 RepID=UPI001BE098C1|nr:MULTISPECIES: helix-turn-helix domain-containing protein [unclassified Rhodanobacter]MBT2145289.1 helix-turn-helix domain-containing protein [Rhodanobacter sp. LX-99]MBT2149334.1 helix-turn-helix domain-containing protein [Rhodanobacter sp. LX-100]
MNTTQENLTPREAAAVLKRSPVTLERWRRLRRGPPFLRVCGRVLYRAGDIAGWLDSQRQEPEPQA